MKTNNKTLLLVALIFILAIGKRANAQNDYKIAEQDSLALVAFYHATDGPNWISNQDGFSKDDLSSEWQGIYDGGYNKWLEGPVKDWFGVTVTKVQNPNSNEASYRVVKLWPVIGRRTDGQNRLNGYIPREIGLLTALRELYINGNNGFEDTEIPDEVYHKSLQWLDIESCGFDGDISDELRNCTDIRKMNFRYNAIDYMPTWDFLDKEAAYNLAGTQWMYSTELSLAIFEKTIDHFYTLSENPKEFGMEMRDVTNVGDEIEIVAPLGSSVEMECTAAGEKEDFITYQWIKDGLSKFGKTKRFYSISSVKESDYGDYTVKITNDYVKAYDGNSNWGEIETKAIHLVAEPVAPVVNWAKTSYNGKEIQLRFSKPMPDELAGFSNFTVSVDGKIVSVASATTKGRLNKDVFLKLAEVIENDQNITINYSGSSVVDKNGGVLESFSDLETENMVRTAPVFVSAKTTKDGSGIELVFDNYIDPASIDIAEFVVAGNSNYSLASGRLMQGEINEHISKTILLTLEQSITDSLEDISITYNKGSLSGLYSGVASGFENENVKNITTLKVTPVTIVFEDGSKELENVLVTGSWGLNAIKLYDNGANGDETAGDHFWTAQLSLVDNSYTWNVISRDIVTSYDTISTTDPTTGVITQTITPVNENIDQVLSEDRILSFQVADDNVQGVTSYGIMNIDVTFNVTANPTQQLFIMGIDDDWLNGMILDRVGDTDLYTITLEGYGVGDVISYNFRDGEEWENQTTESRIYTVVDGENIVNNVFGVFTNISQVNNDVFNVYPNPTRGNLNVANLQSNTQIQISSISGQLVYNKTMPDGCQSIDISHLRAGVYYLNVLRNDSNSSIKIIKTN